MNEAESILTEPNTYLKEFKKDRDQGLKFKDMNDNIRKYKASFVKINMDKKEVELRNFQGKIEKNESDLKSWVDKIQKIKEEIGSSVL